MDQQAGSALQGGQPEPDQVVRTHLGRPGGAIPDHLAEAGLDGEVVRGQVADPVADLAEAHVPVGRDLYLRGLGE